MAMHNPRDHQARNIDPSAKESLAAMSSAAGGITALAGGTQAGTPLQAVFNRVTTVASAADSVLLPPASPGMQCFVTNAAAANSMNVFPAVGEAINALSANTAFALVANKTAHFICTTAGVWNAILTA